MISKIIRRRAARGLCIIVPIIVLLFVAQSQFSLFGKGFLNLPANPAAPQNINERLTDKVAFDMIAIPGGVFEIGSPDDEQGREPHEGPRRTVRVGPFWMGRCEVTWDEYDLYWPRFANKPAPKDPREKAADAVSKPSPPYMDETFGHGRAGHPVLNISYHSAMEYCRWLSAKTGKNYRLPTEAEWEWACRAGTKTPYSFNVGDKLGDYAWYDENAGDNTHPVGKKKPNPWGLCDMHGNVAEWCIDYYEKGAYASFPPGPIVTQPVNQPRNARFPYIVRGGSWAQGAEKCRSAARLASTPEWVRRDPDRNPSIWWLTDADFVGFRVVCVPPENDNLKGIRSPITRDSPAILQNP